MDEKINKKIQILREIRNKIYDLQFRSKTLREQMFKIDKRETRWFYDNCNEARYRIDQMIVQLGNIYSKITSVSKKPTSNEGT